MNDSILDIRSKIRIYEKSKILFIISLIFTSCSSQTDLESLKFDTNISSTIEATKFEKDKNIDFGLVAYVTEDVENFKYGNVNFSNLTIKDNTKNSLIKYTSNLSMLMILILKNYPD